MNERHVRLKEGRAEFAPWGMTAAELAAGGYRRVGDWPRVVPTRRVKSVRYAEGADGTLSRVIEYWPRTFSKLKAVAALTEAGVWPQVKAWIEAAGLYDLYLAAQEFAEDDERFARGLAALKPALGWTDEQVEELLAKCAKEGV